MQTKLAEYQKEYLRDAREYQKGFRVFHFPEDRCTVGVMVQGNFARLTVAFCDHSETKYRKKVGEYLVRERYDNGETIPVPVEGRNAEEIASDFLAFALVL